MLILELKSQRRVSSSSTLSAASAQPETALVPPASVAVVEDAGSEIVQSLSVQDTTAVGNPAAPISPSPPPAMPLPAPVSASSSPLVGVGESNHPLETPPHGSSAPGRGRGGGGRGARASLSRRSPSPSLTSSASDLAVAVSSDARTPARLPQPSAAAIEAAQALQVEHSRFLKCCVGEFGKLVSFVVKDENFAPQWRSVISNQGAP